MGLAGTADGEILCGKAEVHAVNLEHLGEIRAVQNGKNVEPENAGDDAFGFDVGEPAGIDDKLVDAARFRQLGAGDLDIAQGKANLFPKFA